MSLKRKLIRLHSFVSEQLGIDPIKTWAALRGIPEFVRDLSRFHSAYHGKLILNPYLGDRYQEGGSIKNEYFWQDLLVAQRIFNAQPTRHVDVGSRIDGFVAHVASFRSVEVLDIRPVNSIIPGVKFMQADLMSPDSVTALCAGNEGYCDSLSCLHAIEHFGLGRYGDPVHPLGYQQGIENLSKLLIPGGRLYLSTPIGTERVEFNANWVFNPHTILNAANAVGLYIDELTILGQQGGPGTSLLPSSKELDSLAKQHYQLAVFHFIKESAR